MVEPGRPEALPQALRERLLVAEHDPLDHASAFGVETRRNRAGKPGAQSIGEAAEAASVADCRPAVRAQDDVDAQALQPRPLVEAMLLRPWQPHGRDRLDHGTLRRRTTERKLEQDGLMKPEASEAGHVRRDA